MTSTFSRFYHLFFVLVFVAAITTDTLNNIGHLVNFFSYFTVLSMIILTIVFALMFFALDKKLFWIFPLGDLRIVATVSVIISAVIFTFLLSGRPEIKPVPWLNFVYHRLAPLAATISWLVFPPKRRIDWREISYFFAVPVLYLGWIFIRGFLTGWYPYYFLDPGRSDYLHILAFSVVATVVGLILSLALIFVGNLLMESTSKK